MLTHPPSRPLSENIKINDQEDYAVIFGIKCAGALLRTIGVPTPPGQWFRVVQVVDGCSTIETRQDLPAEIAGGHCAAGDRCVCGGDLVRVRVDCDNWIGG